MKSLIRFIAGRKTTVRLVAFGNCCLAMVMLTACAGRKEFQKGYERGAGDTVKRQYWIQQNMQKAGQSKSPYRLTLFTEYQLHLIRTRRSKPCLMRLQSPFTNDAAARRRDTSP